MRIDICEGDGDLFLNIALTLEEIDAIKDGIIVSENMEDSANPVNIGIFREGY
jgi:hypothetical protein